MMATTLIWVVVGAFCVGYWLGWVFDQPPDDWMN